MYFDQASRNASFYGCDQTTGILQEWSFIQFAMDSLVEISDTVYFFSDLTVARLSTSFPKQPWAKAGPWFHRGQAMDMTPLR
jgi:hypothetical protein